MTSHPEPILQPRQGEFHHLLAYVTGPDARAQDAYTGARALFRRRLAVGAALLRRFVVTRAAGRPAAPVRAPDGTPLSAHAQRPTTDAAVVGHVGLGRHAFTAPGPAGRCPLDAARSGPARGDADRRRAWATSGATDASDRERQTGRARSLGLPLRLQARERAVGEAAGEVTPF